MIISNRFVRTYLFGSKVARIHNKSFECCVSTAKEGLFQKLSTIILEPKIGNTVGAGAAGLRPCGKVIYSPTLRKSDRLQFHDAIAKTLDAFGEEGCTLEEALEQIFVDLKRRGIAVETMNLAADQGPADARVPQDDSTQAAVLYRKVAEQGDAVAQFNLGILYHDGHGVPQDDTKRQRGGARRQSKATPRRSTTSRICTTRATVCLRTTLKRRFGIARRLSKATLRRNSYSEVCTTIGHGVPQDYAEAYFWFDLAAAGEQDLSVSKSIANNRDEVASHLTPADLSPRSGTKRGSGSRRIRRSHNDGRVCSDGRFTGRVTAIRLFLENRGSSVLICAPPL